MPISRSILPALLVLAACADPATAPGNATDFAPALREQAVDISCVTRAELGGYSALVRWSGVRVRSVAVTDEDQSYSESLRHPQRTGTVTINTTSPALGFSLDDGRKTVAQGGCSVL